MHETADVTAHKLGGDRNIPACNLRTTRSTVALNIKHLGFQLNAYRAPLRRPMGEEPGLRMRGQGCHDWSELTGFNLERSGT